MTTLNYEKLMALNPSKYCEVINQRGQKVEFFEHPIKGDEYFVIGVIREFKQAFDTEFFDTEDFYENSEYNPIYQHGHIAHAWEFGY